MIFASEKAKEFGYILKNGESMNPKHVENTIHQLNAVQQWITKSRDQVENVYPDVHSAIKTSHAAHALLHHQEKTLLHLFHKGHLDETEYQKLDKLVQGSLNRLFHTGYNSLLSGRSDENILLQSPLFSELTYEQKKLVKQKKEQSDWYKKGDDIIKEGERIKKIFVITRGSIGVYESSMRRTQRSTTNSMLKYGMQLHDTNGSIFDDGDSNGSLNMISRSSGIETKVYTHEQGSIIDVYPLLQETVHHHTFRVEAEPCHGYWLDSKLLKELKDLNIDFWDTIWKYSAVDVIRYYFATEDEAFKGIDLSDLHEKVFNSPLCYFEPNDTKLKKCQIRVNSGLGILLSGCVATLFCVDEEFMAPAVLKPSTEPYIAFSQCVVLYLDFRRGEITNNIDLLNPKLAQLMGGKFTDALNKHDEYESDSSESYSDSNILSDSESIGDEDIKMENHDDSNNDETGGIIRTKTVSINEPNNDNNDDNNDDIKNDEPVIRMKSNDRQPRKSKHLHLNMRESRLPESITQDNINNWNMEEAFEITKYILNKHKGLLGHLQNFHVANKQNEIKQVRESKKFNKNELKSISIFAKPSDDAKENNVLPNKIGIPLVRHQSRYNVTQKHGPKRMSAKIMKQAKRKSKIKAKSKISQLKKKRSSRKNVVTSSKYHRKQSQRQLYGIPHDYDGLTNDNDNDKTKTKNNDNNDTNTNGNSNKTTTKNGNGTRISNHASNNSIIEIDGWAVDPPTHATETFGDRPL